jgi:hypothetical protein
MVEDIILLIDSISNDVKSAFKTAEEISQVNSNIGNITLKFQTDKLMDILMGSQEQLTDVRKYLLEHEQFLDKMQDKIKKALYFEKIS